MNTKLHAVTDARGRPISFFMTAGQVSDYTGAAALLDGLPKADWLLGDRGYDADWFRDALEEKGITPCIPGRKSRNKPVKYDKRRYKSRNKIEIMFGRLKGWRRRIVSQPAMAAILQHECFPGEDVATDEAILDFARNGGSTVYHPVGTCMMGNGPTAVVDPRLRVRGVERLRVVDASIMPRITFGNTHAPTVMIAEKASEMILGEQPPGQEATVPGLMLNRPLTGWSDGLCVEIAFFHS